MADTTLIFKKAIISKAQYAEKSSRWYLTIEDGESSFQVSTESYDSNKVQPLQPYAIEIGLKGFLFGKNQVLSAKSIKFSPVQ